MTNRFLGYADNGGVPEVRLAKPSNPKKPKVRLAKPDDDDDKVTRKVDSMTNEIDRGPFAKILDKMALAHQAQFGGSYEQAYTKVYFRSS